MGSLVKNEYVGLKFRLGVGSENVTADFVVFE
jgi:hypothetical protein